MVFKLTLTTEDGVLISGLWRDAGAEAPAVILLHMMPAAKESYDHFGEALLDVGVSSLAIDFRGHGESRMTAGGGKLNYEKFSDEEHQAKIKDVEAARCWLLEKGVSPSRLAVVGASIGANLALQAMATHTEMPAGLILSPGLNYRGVTTMPLVRALSRQQSLFLIASKDDPESAEAVEKLAEVSLARTVVRVFDAAGHGTAIFDSQPGFMNESISWLRTILG